MSIFKIIKLFILCLLVSNCTKLIPVKFSTEVGNFNSNWEFIKNPADSISRDLFLKNDQEQSSWQKVSLPHTANLEPVDSPEKQWQGIARYRKFFTVSKEFEDKSVSLKFGAAMQVAKIYLNGELIQTHLGGYLPFDVKLDGKISFGKQNCILVELDNRDNLLVPPGKPLATLDFNYYSGLYRNVTLRIKDKLHISDPVTSERVAGGGLLVYFSDVTRQSAKVNLQVDVENEYSTLKSASLKITMIDAAGKTVAFSNETSQNIQPSGFFSFNRQFLLQNPQLWSVDSPDLYRLKVVVYNNIQPVDSMLDVVGIRTLSFSGDGGFILNGQKLKLRGTNRHQEYPYIGNAVSDYAQYRDAFKIKTAGFNFVRCSHYPQSPAFLSACDELGILVMDAIPGWQYVGDEEFQNNSIRDVRQMVRRDRNHPSIILWEASLNESGMTRQFMERAHQAVHEELPVPDVFTCGWIDSVYDVFIPARQHARPPYYWNKYTGGKPIIIAEYGDWEYYAQNAGFNQTAFAGLKPEERTSRQLRGSGQKRLAQQALNYQESHNDNLNGPAAGDANWLMFDYKRGYAPDIESSGVMDIFRLPKFAYYFFQSQAEKAEPMIFIANYWNDTQFSNVKVYSNCDEVELSMNGNIIARQKPDKDRNSTNLIHPPFSFKITEPVSGKLKAKGFIAGKEVVNAERKTPAAAAKIVLTVDLSGKELQAGKNDVIFVYASVADSEGTVIPDDKRAISFMVEGDAEYIGDNPRNAEAGISTILLKAGEKPGNIQIKATAEGLASGEMIISSKLFSESGFKNDTVASLDYVIESYKLSGRSLTALAEKILYKKTPQENMYLYLLRPIVKTKRELPAIVYFTGGGWVDGNVEGQIPNAAWFRDQGIIGIDADYRVKSRHGTTPIECIQDAKSAIRYVRAHAKELGIDPDRIIAAGGSAGGHLAACTFIDGGDAQGEDLKISSKPDALVLHNPVLGEGFGNEFFAVYPEFAPILHVKKGWPPTILSNGTNDKTTPFEVAEKFTRLMKEAGNVCELIPVKDADHSCDWPVSNPNFLPTLQRMTDFLREQKFIK